MLDSNSISGFILVEPSKTMRQLPLIFQGIPGCVQRGSDLNLLYYSHTLEILGVQRLPSIYYQILHQLGLLQMIYQPMLNEDVREQSTQRNVGSGLHIIPGFSD